MKASIKIETPLLGLQTATDNVLCVQTSLWSLNSPQDRITINPKEILYLQPLFCCCNSFSRYQSFIHLAFAEILEHQRCNILKHPTRDKMGFSTAHSRNSCTGVQSFLHTSFTYAHWQRALHNSWNGPTHIDSWSGERTFDWILAAAASTLRRRYHFHIQQKHNACK